MFRKASEHTLSTERIKGLPFEGSAVTSTVTRGFTNTHTVSLNHISIEILALPVTLQTTGTFFYLLDT